MGKQVKLDPIRAAYEENKLANNTKFYNPLNNLEDDSKYLQGFDAVNANSINDYKANKQKWYEALTNSLVKNTAKAGIRYVDGFLGIGSALLYDIPSDIMGKEDTTFTSILEDVYDNSYSQNVTRPFEEWLDKELPVYQTERQQQSYGVGNLGFLDKVLDGVAYVAGMAGGAKVAALGAKGLGKIGSLMSAAAREGKDLNYVKNLFGNTADDLIGALGKGDKSVVKDIVKNAWDDLFGAVVESGAEASETKKTIFENLKRKAIVENGGNPLTKEQEAQLDKQASVGGAANFMTNLITTGMVNNVVFKPLIKSKWLDDAFDNKAINNELINPNFIGKRGTEYVLDKANKNQKLYQKLFQTNVAKNAALEGGQELVQFASNDYFVNLLSDPSKQSVQDIAELYDITTKNGLEALLKTGKNLSSVDAVHSALIGGLIGGGAGALQDFSSKGAIDANTQYAIDYANRNSLANKDVTAAIKNFAKSKEYSQVADAASKNGDRLTYETAKYLGFANYVNARVNMSKFEDVLQDLKELKAKPIEEFVKQFDLADYKTLDIKKRDEMIDYAIGVANQIKSSQDKIMANYGHKISALEAKSPDNEKILPFLTSLDALKANYTNRENELIDKFKANGVDYTAFQKKEKSEEQIAASRGKIGELTSQLSALQADKSMPVDDRLKQINEISNQLVKANDELQRTVTESTYKELFKKELTDEFQPEVDEKSQRAIYETFSKDIKDFTQIQTAKEKLIDFYSKIINDESYAEKVAKKLVARNQDDEISNLFTVSGNVVNNPSITKGETEDGEETEVVGKDNYEFEVGEAKSPESYREHYIKTGDVYQLNRKLYKYDKGYDYKYNKAQQNIKGEAYEMFEVIDTRTTANPNGSLKGEVRISNNNGYKEWLDVRDFKKMIKPIGNSANADIKMDARSEEHQFYQKYKNRGIRFVRNGVTYIGKMSVPYPKKTNKGKSIFVAPSTYNITFLNKEGKKETLENIDFYDKIDSKNNISSIEILGEDLSTLLDLKLNAEFYIKILLKTIDTKSETVNKYKDKLNAILNNNNQAVNNLSDDIKKLIIESINLNIDTREHDIEVLQESIKNLKFFTDENIKINPDIEIPEVIQKAIDKVTAYRESNNKLKESETQNLLKEKIKVIGEERKVAVEQLASLGDNIRNLLPKEDELSQEILNREPDITQAVLEILDNNPDIKNNNSNYIELYKNLLTKEIEINNVRQELEDDLYNSISKETGLNNPEAVKLGELNALIGFWNYTTNKGYRYSSGFGKWFSKDYEEDNDTNIESKIEAKDIIKTVLPSDFSKINEGLYQVEKQNFFKYFYQVPVNSDTQLEVEIVDDTIYLKFEHNKLPMVTTLAATGGNKLKEFRTKLIAEYNKNLNNKEKTFIVPNGKISLFEKGSVNKPIEEVFSDVDLKIIVAKGEEGDREAYREVNGIEYVLKNGRPYLINDDLGIIQPVIVGTLEEAKIKRYDEVTKKTETYSLVDVILNNIKFLQISKLKKSDNDYQKDISNFYSNLNSFVYTANFDSIGTDKGMKKGAIDIIERDGIWALGYLDEKGNKQLVPIFDEDGEVTQLVKEQLGRRLVNPKLESLAEEGKKGFRYNEKFFIPVDFYLQKDGTPKLKYKDDSDYTYSKFLKESAGLKSNLAVQNIADKPTYFKGGYFTFNENVKVSNQSKKATTESKIAKSNSLADIGLNMVSALGINKEESTPKKKSLAEAGKNMAESIFGAKGTSIEETPITPNPVTNVEAEKESSDVIDGGFGLGAILPGLGSKINKDFAPISLEIAQTERLENITQEEVNEARTKFEKNYGVNFELVNGLINSYSWGRVTEAGNILLSDVAPLGTSYHEEFHLVSQHILSKNELDEIYKEARIRYGDKSDYELEETLAEGFRMYANGYRGFAGKIAYYFNKLLSAVKSLIGIKDTPINQLYSDILGGKYYGKPIYKGTVRNNEQLNYDEKQMILSHITKGVINLIKNHAYANDENSFIQFIDDSFYREKLIKYELTEDDVIGERAKKLIARNPNLINFYFNNSILTYVNHLQGNPLLLTKLGATYGKNEAQLLQDAKSYFNTLLKTNIEEEITEEEQAATADVRKKGDTEVDFFTGNLTKLRLLIVNESDGTEYGSLNPSTFMSMIYNHIRDNNENISTFEQFKDGLKYIANNEKIKNKYGQAYIDGLSNIMTMLDFNKELTKDTNRSKIQLQNLLFEVFSKVENEFQVMKVISDTEDGNNIITRAFVNQTVAKQFDNIDKKVKASITDYLLTNQPEFPKGFATKEYVAEFANRLFNTNIYTAEEFKDATSKDRMLSILQAVSRGYINDSKKVNKKNPTEVLNYLKTSIDSVINKIATLEGVDKIFNIRNAEGSPQYSLSNYSSLHKKMEEYATKSNPVKSDLEFTGLVMMNGIQTKGEEVEAITANKLTKNDILLYYIDSVLKDGILPYAFSGDKSTLLGIRAKGNLLKGNSNLREVYSKLLDKEINFVNSFNGKLPFKGMQLEYPLFQFLEGTSLYTQLKNNPNDPTTKNEIIDALIEHINQKAKELKTKVQTITGQDLYSIEELEKFYHTYTVSIAEQTNELTGSLNFYKDFAKRAYAISSTKLNLRLDKPFIDWYNEVYNVNFPINPNGLRAVMLEDVEPKGDYLKNLGDFSNAADAQGYMYYHSARFMLQASARWNEKLDRIFRDLDRLEAKSELTKEDTDNHNELINQLNEQVSVLKPQYFGFQDYNGVQVPTFYKLSVLPLSKVITQDRNIDKARQLMKSSKIDIVAFASANKVGQYAENGVLKMYDKDGNFILDKQDNPITYYTGNIKSDKNTIFVFGSNPEGRHGAGAAKIAKEQFGAKYGQGEGLQGNAYALPTKDLRVKFNNGFKSISEKDIINSIKKLYQTAKQNSDKQFKVAYRNTTDKSLNGYTGLEMIDMFIEAGNIPSNIVFSKEWFDTGKFKDNNPIDIEDYVQTSDWKYLGIQVEMPLAHESVTFGTQMRKLITESLPKSITINGKEVLGEDLIKKHENLIIKKIEEDTAKFIKRFALDKDFNLVDENNKEEFKKQLIQQATSREVPDSFIQSLRDNDSWDYIMNKSTLQKILNASIRNSIITQKMPGDAKAMVSSVGFEKTGQSIKYENRLKFYSKNNDAIEILLPYQYIDAYKDYVTFANGEYIINDDAPDNLINLIGYRIPTQGHASIDKIRIKGFLPKSYGNAIVVPYELSKKAGSDFDIDKLNIFFPKLKDNKYDTESTENEILALYNDILGSPEYRELLNTSIDNNEIADIIKNEIELEKNIKKLDAGYLMFDPVYAVDRRYSFMTAKSTLGSVALHATHNAESQKHKLGFIVRSKSGSSNKKNNFDLLELLNIFESGRQITKEVKDILPLYNPESTLMRDGKPVKVSDILSQFMNATVDAAKDDYITSANFDLETVNVALMLVRLGVNPREVLMFISNPAIVAYTDLKKARKDLSYNVSGIDDKINALKNKAGSNRFTQQTSESLKDKLNTADYGLLKTYLGLEEFSNILSDLMNLSNFDTKGNGKSIEENEAREKQYKDSMKDFKDYISGFEESSLPTNSFQSSFREVAFKANNFSGIAFELNELYKKNISYKDSLDKLAYNKKIVIGYSSEGKPITKNLSADERTYKANRFKQMFLTGLLQYNILIANQGKQPNLKQLYKSIQSSLPNDNYLKTKLQFMDNAEGEVGQNAIIINGGASLSVDESNRITEAFENLYRLAPQVAKDLVTFSIFQSGVINSPVTIYHVIPDHIIKEVALPNKQSINLFQDLLNNAQTYSKEDVIKKLVLSVDTKLGERKSKYRNKMLTLLAEKNIKVC